MNQNPSNTSPNKPTNSHSQEATPLNTNLNKTSFSNQESTAPNKMSQKSKFNDREENIREQVHTQRKLKQLGVEIDRIQKSLLQTQSYLLSALKPKQLPPVNSQVKPGSQANTVMQAEVLNQKQHQQAIQTAFKDHLLSSNKIRDYLNQKSKIHQIQKQTKVLGAKMEIQKCQQQIRDQRRDFEEKQQIYKKQLQKGNQIVDKLVQRQKQILEKNVEIKILQEQVKKYQSETKQLTKNLVESESENKQMRQRIQALQSLLSKRQLQIKALKQQNIEIKLVNKNVKADNRIVTEYLDKTFNQNIRNQRQTERRKLLEKEARIINEIYKKTLQNQGSSKNVYRYQSAVSNDLTNKILLQQYKQQSTQKQKRLMRQIESLQEKNRLLSYQNLNKQTEIDNLKQMLKNSQMLKNMKVQIFNKRETVLKRYEQSNKELAEQNKQLKKEIQKCKKQEEIVSISKKILASRNGKIYQSQYRRQQSTPKYKIIINPNPQI